MKRKILWLGVSWLIVAALVLASCAPTVPGEEEEEEEEEEWEVVTLSIGETYQTPEVDVTVSEAIVTDSYEYYDQASESMATKEASPGTYFLIITVEINRVGSQIRRARQTEGPYWFRAFASDGTRYSYQTYLGENPLQMFTLSAGEEVRGKVLFNIPEGAGGLKIVYGIASGYYEEKILAEWEIE